jgi:hypothetical protein
MPRERRRYCVPGRFQEALLIAEDPLSDRVPPRSRAAEAPV